jgi:hypothetical protein
MTRCLKCGTEVPPLEAKCFRCHSMMPSAGRVKSIDERFAVGETEGGRIEIVRIFLKEIIKRMDHACEEAVHQVAAGYFPDYEAQVMRIRWIYYRTFEDYIRNTFGDQKAREISLRIFRNIWMDLKDLGWGHKDRNSGRKADFNLWYYGKRVYILKPEYEITYLDSWAYLFLIDGLREWAWDFSTYLVMNMEIAIYVIIEELETGTFNPYLLEDQFPQPASYIYRILDGQMERADQFLVATGNSAYFKPKRRWKW